MFINMPLMTLGQVLDQMIAESEKVLGREDSNPHQQNQNLRSCP